jgi:uroporphyrinogen-III decarboxylase
MAQGFAVLSPGVTAIPYEYFCGGRTIKEFILDLHRTPDLVQAAMDAAIGPMKEATRQQAKAVAPLAMWVGGWRSASEFLSPRLWQRFVFPYLKEIVEVIVQEGAVPLLHFDADWTRDLEYLRQLPKGKVILGLDSATDIFKAKEVLGDHMCILGDVPPRMLSLGSPEEVTAYCHRLVTEVGPGGFILSQGCVLPPEAKLGNVQAMVRSVQL